MHTGSHTRIVVDLPGSTLFLKGRTRDEEIAARLTNVLNTDIQIEGDAVVIRAENRDPNDAAFKIWDGSEVLVIGSLDAKTVLAALRGPHGATMLKKLEDQGRKGFEVTVLSDKATRKTQSYTVAAPR